MRSKLLFLFTVACLLGYAQKPPGYMGKRVSASYQFGLSPVFFSPQGMISGINSLLADESEDLQPFQFSHFGRVEFVTGNRASIGAHFGTGSLTVSPGEVNGNSLKESDRQGIYREFGGDLRMFGRGMYSPVGRYFVFAISKVQLEFREDKVQTLGNGQFGSAPAEYNVSTLQCSGTRIGIGLGRNLMLTKSIGYNLEVMIRGNVYADQAVLSEDLRMLAFYMQKAFNRDGFIYVKTGVSFHL